MDPACQLSLLDTSAEPMERFEDAMLFADKVSV